MPLLVGCPPPKAAYSAVVSPTRLRCAVVDYGMGNLHSVGKALQRLGAEVSLVDHPAAFDSAERLVLPGVGGMRAGIDTLCQRGLDRAIADYVRSGRPLLAICLGLQMLLQHSEEHGGVDGLGLLSGTGLGFGEELSDADGVRLKVPHMGWNRVYQRRDHPLWHGIADGERFYFVHSYHCQVASAEVVAESDYGLRFTAAAASGSLFATQFHPEKSQRAGLQLLENFLAWSGAEE